MRRKRPEEGDESVVSAPVEATAVLLARVREGDERAREVLAARFLVPLRRWAHGRLPVSARDLVDTDDVVQGAVVRALGHVKTFEPRGEGAFFAYLRQILLNQIRDEARRGRRRPPHDELPDTLRSDQQSPLEAAIGKDQLERYEAALANLAERHREALILRVEMGYRYREIADALDLPSPNAARKLIGRALLLLGAGMGGPRGT